jgi:hypothetical protein
MLLAAAAACLPIWSVAPAGVYAHEVETMPAAASTSTSGGRYIEQTSAGLPGVLDYRGEKLTDDPAFGGTSARPIRLPASIVFGFGIPGKAQQANQSLPPFDEQGRILDRLLSRLIAEHPDIPSQLRLLLGASREGLIEALDRKLVEPGSDWDTKLGLPRHLTSKNDNERFAKLCAYLTSQLDGILQSSPIARAFKVHGYTLSVRSVSASSMSPMIAPKTEMGGARLPYDLNMEIVATRAADKG